MRLCCYGTLPFSSAFHIIQLARNTTVIFSESVETMSLAQEGVRQSFANFHVSDNARVHAGNDHYGDNNNYYYPHERPVSPLTPFSNVPFAHDPDYVDRKAISDEIHRKLVPGARLALVGLGGVG